MTGSVWRGCQGVNNWASLWPMQILRLKLGNWFENFCWSGRFQNHVGSDDDPADTGADAGCSVLLSYYNWGGRPMKENNQKFPNMSLGMHYISKPNEFSVPPCFGIILWNFALSEWNVFPIKPFHGSLAFERQICNSSI